MATSRRLDHIDGLRGLAALAVVLQHALQTIHQAGHATFDFLLYQINLGRFGVVLFFLISGCVIPFSFRGDHPLRNFAVSRFFRLYPAYWLSIPVVALVALSRGDAVTPEMVLSNLTMMQGFWSGKNIGILYWTLNFEMGFYVLCALLFWRGWLQDARIVTALAAALIAGLLWSLALGGAANYNEGPYFIALFLLGTVMRQALIDGDQRARRCMEWLAGLSIIAGVVLSWNSPFAANDAVVGPFLTPLALGTSMTMPIVLFAAVLHWRPSVPRLTVWLGAISYSVYLFQDIGLSLAPRLFGPQAHPLLYMALVLGMTIAIAALIHRFVEQPMIALGRRITHGTRKPEQAFAPG